MRKTLLTILITALISIAGCFGLFWWETTPNNQSALDLINQVTHGNVTVLNQFPSVGNLEGYVIQTTDANHAQSVVYVDHRGRYLIFGTLISKQGQNLSNQDYQTYIAPQAASVAFNYISNVTYIEQGRSQAPHQAYIVFDPNCVFCHRLFLALQPFIQQGTLAVRWIPVAFLKPTSKGRVYAILSSPNPLSMMLQNESTFNEQTENGGVPPLNTPSSQVIQQLQNNMAFLTEAQINSTPTLLYKTNSGIANLTSGMIDPSRLNALIQGLGSCF